jgi:2-isopropylmalate synthase
MKDQGKKVFFDSEHFFDGYFTNRQYTMQVLSTAAKAGAEYLVLCDTNGGYLPLQVQEAVKDVIQKFKIPVGIHCHNDSGFANSNALIAFQAGATQIQGTFNGFGERCGNSDLVTLIPTLKFKLGVNCIDDEKVKNLTAVARFIYELANMPPREDQPYVGRNAFSHKGGIHISAVLKDNRTYEHLNPLLVGNDRNIKVSELAGRSSIIYKAKQFGIPLVEGSPKVDQILKIIKEKERQGYSYEGADGSLELIMRSLDYNIEDPQFFRKKYFGIEGFRVISEYLKNVASTEATIKVRVREKEFHTAAEGNGPVNAIDEALRKALVFFYPSLKNISLSDFKVRIIVQSGTASVVRVLVETKDVKTNETWSTIGAHENIIVASWEALLDSYVYKLLKDNIDWTDKAGT